MTITTGKQEEFRNLCKRFVEKEVTIGVIFHHIKKNKWLKGCEQKSG